MLRYAVIVISLTLAGCTQQRGNITFERTDGQRAQGNPKLMAQYEQDAAVCKGEAAKASLSAGAVYGRGVVGAIAMDQTVAKQQQSVDAVAIGCMAGRGYKVRSPA